MRAHILKAAAAIPMAPIALVVLACQPPDRPPALPDPLPVEAQDFLRPDSTRVVTLSPGVSYRYVWSQRGPWAVHLVEADLTRCALGFHVASAPPQEGMRGGRATVSELFRLHGGQVLAAVNGDFFTPEGLPLGPEVVAGRSRTGWTRPALASRAGAPLPWIGTTGVSQDRVVAPGWPLAQGAPAAVDVVGGYPELLDRGRRAGDLAVSANPGFGASRHPRTAVAVGVDEARAWLVVVDGRQGDYSTGMTLPELTELLESLGAEEALNLDGGGSSTLVVGGRVVNRPSDETGERAVANALLLIRDPVRCSVLSGPGRP